MLSHPQGDGSYDPWSTPRAAPGCVLGNSIAPNSTTDTYQISVPVGGVNDPDSKLYPFKYKTSDYPLRTETSELIALDTANFFVHADGDKAARWGLINMGYDGGNPEVPDDTFDDYQWVTTDTSQLLNHQVSPHDDAWSCSQCHMSRSGLDLQGDLGFAPFDSNRATCSAGCHSSEKAWEWSYGSVEEHKEGDKTHWEKGVACNRCHRFSR